MASAILPHNVTLEYEIHGQLSQPVIFPILGITDNITDWPPALYEPFVEAGYCVVRHELRDSGFSTKIDGWGEADLAAAAETLQNGEIPKAPYTIHDVADDAAELLH